MPSLLEMPEDVMNIILKESDYCSIQNLRKSCRDLRHFIDDVKPESTMTELYIRFECDYIILNLEFSKEPSKRIFYYDQKEQCYLRCETTGSYPSKQKFLQNLDFIDLACRDIKLALYLKNSDLPKLDIDLRNSYKPSDQLLTSLIETLSSRPRPLKVHKFNMESKSLQQVSTVLPLLDPKKLYEIAIEKVRDSENFDFSKMVNLEQWKRARWLMLCDKKMDFENFENLENFLHFETVIVYVKCLTLDLVLRLKEVFLGSAHMKWYKLMNQDFQLSVALYDRFGAPHFQYGNSHWYFQIPAVSTKIVLLKLLSNYCISFERIERDKVPAGARVH